MINPNDPIHQTVDADNKILNHGLNKREYFASLALQGLLSNSHNMGNTVEADAILAVKAADALKNLGAKSLFEAIKH